LKTEEYLSERRGDEAQSDEPKKEDLPDLKTAVARGFPYGRFDRCVLTVLVQVHQWTFQE